MLCKIELIKHDQSAVVKRQSIVKYAEQKSWVKVNLRENKMKFIDLKEEALSLWSSGDYESHMKLTEYLYEKYDLVGNVDYSRRTLSIWIKNDNADKEIVSENVKLSKQKQKQQDINRIERKAFREHVRVENAVSELSSALIDQLTIYSKDLSKKINISNCGIINGGIGVIQITDTHGNELIDLKHNQYNFDILAKRLKKQISESISYFKYRGVEKVLIAFTGDLINSSRRLDEILNQATNNAKGCILMSHIFLQAILQVREHYEVDVISVLGNESRISKEMTFSNEAFSENYDLIIVSTCRQAIELAGIEGITFHSIDKMETTVDFGEQRWLFAHDVSKFTDKQDKTQSVIGRYHLAGEPIDFVLGGHIHAHRGTDYACRSGSLSGSNTYNEHALNLQGRASAVCYVVKGKERFYQYIDCQYYDNDGYEVLSQLKAYNIKSSEKLKDNTVIHKIVI